MHKRIRFFLPFFIWLPLFLFFLTSVAPNIVKAESQSGDIHVNGLVTGPPPSTPPTIEVPAPETTFHKKSIEVKGSCVAGLIVKIYRNNFFAGSALCKSDGTYSLMIDLFQGKNNLVARQFDSLGQSSPESNTVIVYFVPLTPSLPNQQFPDASLPDQTPNTPSAPPAPNEDGSDAQQQPIDQFLLLVDYDYTLQSIFTNQPFYLPVEFVGGKAPYAVSIDWGDETNDVFSRTDTTQFTAEHTYQNAGYYTITIKVSDQNNDTASLQFVVYVQGKIKAPSFVQAISDQNPLLWWIIGVGMVISWVVAYFAGKSRGKIAK